MKYNNNGMLVVIINLTSPSPETRNQQRQLWPYVVLNESHLPPLAHENLGKYLLIMSLYMLLATKPAAFQATSI